MKKFLVSCVTLLLLMVLFTVLSIVSPIAHKTYIRHYVGSKVVKIVTSSGGGGSGFHVVGDSGKTYIMTNNHVCLGADVGGYVTVMVGKKKVKRKILKRMKTHDLCAVQALDDVSGLYVANRVFIGEKVALVGHPGLRPLSLSIGEVIGRHTIKVMFGRNLPDNYCIGDNLEVREVRSNILQMVFKMLSVRTICVAKLEGTMLNAISYSGNSGSPVVDIFGRVIGVLFAGSSQPTDAYLVPLPVFKSFLKEL